MLRFTFLSTLLALLFVGCGPESRGRDRDRDVCERPCGEECCTGSLSCIEGQCVACDPLSCESLGFFCGTVSDGCGGELDCGACPEGQSCGGGGSEGRCGKDSCSSETDAELCTLKGRNCGTLTVNDSCGTARTVSCGSCTAPEVCGGSGREGVCAQEGAACVPETDRQFCTRLGKDCGPLSDFDNCDASRTVANCGNCTDPKTCGGDNRPGVCGCTGETNAQLCSAAGATCGSITVTDKCGTTRTVSCGSCSGSQSCGGGGTPNRCGCTGETNAQLCSARGATCGSITVTDQCGTTRTVSCGSCSSPQSCGGGGAANQCGCTGETNAQLCSARGANCGSISVTDKCGTSRTVNCGSCSSPQSCGGGGTTNRCGCTTTQTNAQLCQSQGYTCGSATINDSCGVARNISSCGTCTSPAYCSTSTWNPNVCLCNGESEAELCLAAGASCGQLTRTDRCGVSRTLNCGTCAGEGTCSASNQCVCEPETSAQFCARYGKNCGSVTRTDNCGATKTYNCGSCGAGETCSATLNTCSAWKEAPVGTFSTSQDINGVWGLSDTEVYMTMDSDGNGSPRLLRYTGSAVELVNVFGTSTLVPSGVTMTSATDVWATPGAVYFIARGTMPNPGGSPLYKAVLYKSTGGTNWKSSLQIMDVSDGVSWNVRGTSASNLFQVMTGTSTYPARIRRFDGSNWSDIALHSSIASDEMLHGIMPFSPTSAFFSANSGAYLWELTASGMKAHPTPHSGYFDIWGSSASDVWMVGSFGKVAHWNGSSVSDRSPPDAENVWLYDVHGTGPNDVWVVGSNAYIAHWNGSRWTREAAPNTKWLNGVWASPTRVIAVGSSGNIIVRPR